MSTYVICAIGLGNFANIFIYIENTCQAIFYRLILFAWNIEWLLIFYQYIFLIITYFDIGYQFSVCSIKKQLKT